MDYTGIASVVYLYWEIEIELGKSFLYFFSWIGFGNFCWEIVLGMEGWKDIEVDTFMYFGVLYFFDGDCFVRSYGN